MTIAVWPVGLLLTVAYAVAGLVPLPVFVVVDLAYLAAVAVVVRRAGTIAGLLVAPAGLIFSLAALTGAPTAREPAMMVANGGALAAAGAVLLTGAVLVAVHVWDGAGRGPAALAVTALVVGTTGYLVNLLARAAVALSGAAPAQAAVEDRAWQAHAYLRGLVGEPDPLTLLLVWLDLMQVAYVVLAFLGAALLAVAAHRPDGSADARRARSRGWAPVWPPPWWSPPSSAGASTVAPRTFGGQPTGEAVEARARIGDRAETDGVRRRSAVNTGSRAGSLCGQHAPPQ